MLNVAFIGTGRISTLHAIGYLNNPEARIAAVADVDRSVALERGRLWGVEDEFVFTDYQQVLALPQIDAVEILLPHHLHHRVTLEALAAGKHVSVQKPIAGTVAEADEMVAAAYSAGKVLKVYENIIFYPPIQLARKLIDDGAIGKPITLRHKTFAGRSPKAWAIPESSWEWRADRSLAGGGQWLTDDGHHAYSLAWFLFGSATDLFVWAGETPAHGAIIDVPALVSYKFPDNRLGSWEATWSPELEIDTEFYAADDVIEITGTHGVLWVTRCMGNMLGQSPVVLYKDGTFQHFDDVATGWDVSFLRSTQDFVTSMMNGSSPLLSGPQGREILSWCLAAEASAASGRQVAIFE